MSKLFSLLQKIGVVDSTSEHSGPIVYNPEEKALTSSSVPLDTYFITPRIALIPFPTAELAAPLYSFFHCQYRSRYMIWNISEYFHPTKALSSQTIDLVFVGYPNAPLSVIYSIFNSVHSWLTNPDNIAVFHCQNTKGRSYMFLASYLTWTLDFPDPISAFNKICAITQTEVELLPSQFRYMNYIQLLMNGPLPKTRKIRIQKIIMDGIPMIESEGTAVRPYIQIFKGSEIIYSSCSKEMPPVSYYLTDISISFELDLEVDGDVLIRCRHLGKDHKVITIFRTMFHTAFCNDLVVRFRKNELDGAFNDDRFPLEFTFDLFLAESLEIEDSELDKNYCVFKNPEKKHSNPEENKIQSPVVSRQGLKGDNDSDEELDDYFKKLESK